MRGDAVCIVAFRFSGEQCSVFTMPEHVHCIEGEHNEQEVARTSHLSAHAHGCGIPLSNLGSFTSPHRLHCIGHEREGGEVEQTLWRNGGEHG